MQKKQALKSGVILASALVTKKQGLFDTMATKYNILIKGRMSHKSLTEEEYFAIMDDLSLEYYQTGHPNPKQVQTEMFNDYTEN